MLYCSNQLVQFLLSGCLTVFIVSSVVKAEGRVFVLDPRNLRGFREAEQACASQNARLASVEELRQAVVECFFSHCTRGWLYGGTVGTTVCNTEGSSLKALSVRTENATEDTADLGAFCIKDKAGACGDPPFFPNTRLQDYSGFEIGDELLYMCTPGYVMPSGHTAFSLLCDSCGEWYGTVQICAKDPAETHVDYEDKFEDSYGEADHDHDSQEEVFGDVSQDGKRILQQQEKRFWINVEGNQPNLHKVNKVNNSRTFEGTVDETTKREQGAFTVRPRFEQDRPKLVQTGAAAATEEPVSLLSQKHMFWFPSEAFQEEIPPIASTQATQRASGARSEESKETESQERLERIDPVDDDGDPDNVDLDRNDDRDDERDIFEDPGDNRDDNDDHDDSRHHDLDIHEDDHTDDTDDHDDPDSRQEEDFNDNVKQPGHYDDLDRPDRSKEDADDHDDRYDMGEHEDDRDRTQEYSDRDDAYDDHPSKEDHKHDDHDDHYDMGEHEDDRDRTQEYDDRDDAYDDHPSKEDHEDHPSKEDHEDRPSKKDHEDHPSKEDHEDDHRDNDGEHPDNSKEHAETDDHDGEHYDHDEDDIYDDHEDKDEESYDDHDSHEKNDDHLHLIISVANERRPNITQREAGGKTTKENAWLDGYPVDVFDTKTADSTKGQMRPNGAKTTDKPNDMEARKRVPQISLSDEDLSSTTAPKSDQGREKGWFRFRTPATSSDHLNSPSYSDTLDYDTQEVAPTRSLLDDLTNHPFLDHGPAPPVHDGNTFPGAMEEHSVDNLPGEMGEIEGEKRKTICVGEDCPPDPPTSNTQGAKVAAIIVAVCAVATAVIIGVWCYRRKQQKSSLYEMNGKGQSQSGQGQQIEMQQKV